MEYGIDRLLPGGIPGSARFGDDATLPSGVRLATDLARHIAQVPVAHVSLMGMGGPCYLDDPILGMGEPILIEDLREHPRFQAHPLVAGPQGHVFWAAFPMMTEDGFLLGALCLMDRQPRRLDRDSTSLLQRITQEMTTLLHRSTVQAIRPANQMERLLGALQRRAGVEDVATALCFLRMCEGHPPSQRDEILLPAAGLARIVLSGERMEPTLLAQDLMVEHGMTPPQPQQKARALAVDDVVADTLASLML